jgi:methyltransferase (TIGR00027 family)
MRRCEAMRKGHASRTAEFMALFRALESSRPADGRLFDDTLARSFLNWPLSAVARLAIVPGLGRVLPWIIDRRVPGTRSSAVARTRFIDDEIEACAQAGTEQIVILGAGFDCRAQRLPSLRGVRIFEVDHPDTLAAKRRVLERLSAVRENVRFVPTDFNLRELESAMAAAGYREPARTFFLWEGVTNYLTEEAVDATLRWCSRAAPGSRILFTYVHRDVLTKPGAFVGTARLFASLEKLGEKWTFGIEPAELRQFLSERGLLLEIDLGACEYRERYFHAAAREMRGYEFYRIALARVKDRSAPPAAGVKPSGK